MCQRTGPIGFNVFIFEDAKVKPLKKQRQHLLPKTLRVGPAGNRPRVSVPVPDKLLTHPSLGLVLELWLGLELPEPYRGLGE